jgi:hypothetical protein
MPVMHHRQATMVHFDGKHIYFTSRVYIFNKVRYFAEAVRQNDVLKFLPRVNLVTTVLI